VASVSGTYNRQTIMNTGQLTVAALLRSNTSYNNDNLLLLSMSPQGPFLPADTPRRRTDGQRSVTVAV